MKRSVSLAVGALVLLLLTSSCAAGETRRITKNMFSSKETMDGVTYDVAAIRVTVGHIDVTISDPKIRGEGLKFSGFKGVSDDLRLSLNLTLLNLVVEDSTVTVFQSLPRSTFFFISKTKANMTGSTPLFVFNEVIPQYYVIINIVDTSVTWKSSTGGDVLQITGASNFVPKWESAMYITRTWAYNARHIWNVVYTGTRWTYFVDVREDSMVAIDYAYCLPCLSAFINSESSSTPPIVGSEDNMVRYSNCTNVGGQPFYASSCRDTFSIGPNGGNMIFSGIETDGVFFDFAPNTQGQIKQDTKLTFMHINAFSSGIKPSNPFPYYETTSWASAFMGNVTFGGVLLSGANAYQSANLQPGFIVDEYSRFISLSNYKGYTSPYKYTVNQFTDAFCSVFYPRAQRVYTLGVETLGSAGKTWQRPQCICSSWLYKPYCTRVYDPLLYYAGYTFDLVECGVPNCEQCRWGTSGLCTQCSDGYIIHPQTQQCIPNICGECPTNGKYTYVNGKCVANKVANCAEVDKDGKCIACDAHYNVYNGQCMQCNVENCALCSANNVCGQCNNDQAYNLVNGKCIYCTSHCSACDTSGCKTCDEGYKKDGDRCVPLCSIDNCVKCKSETECGVCKDKLTLKDGKCTCNIEHCDVCFNDLCKQCAQGYTYSIRTNTCVPMNSRGSGASGPLLVRYATVVTALLCLASWLL